MVSAGRTAFAGSRTIGAGALGTAAVVPAPRPAPPHALRASAAASTTPAEALPVTAPRRAGDPRTRVVARDALPVTAPRRAGDPRTRVVEPDRPRPADWPAGTPWRPRPACACRCPPRR